MRALPAAKGVEMKYELDAWGNKIYSVTGDFKRRLHNCFELSYEYVMAHPNALLIHGSVKFDNFYTDHGGISTHGQRILHAYVQLPNGKIWEPIFDRSITLQESKALFNAVPISAYTKAQAKMMMSNTLHYGPWS